MAAEDLKKAIREKAQMLGANLVHSCAVEKWAEIPLQDPEFWPQNIWPWVKNVIVLGIPLPVPMVSTTPSMVYQELYNTSNRVLDDIAYHLTNHLSELGYKALFFPRDGYYNLDVLLDKPQAAFSHVLAGYYAGLGTIGDSHNLLTKEFGPRVRLVSILTDAPLPPDEMLTENLCRHCKKCRGTVPHSAFMENNHSPYNMNKTACIEYHLLLKKEHHWPCGVCLNVCPVGADLERYRDEQIVSEKGKEHCRYHGS